ncbi:hypothetical protein HGRIS_000564 [Hohenbuehelia grisea]|uniref:F-box domain-containing protein n=1 Tax=Hohenbuehelia grisea TaxID=104357 RepID=A0ABR3JRK7_9AGAR
MASTWFALPTEMKLAVVDVLGQEDLKALSRVDKGTYSICVPSIFKDVTLKNWSAVNSFLESVPASYLRYIQLLDFCTANEDPMDSFSNPFSRTRSDAVATFLTSCPRLSRLAMRLSGCLDKSVLPAFSALRDLRDLTISNCGDEAQCPLSERFIVSLAASIPSLEELSLDRITRSIMHAPELVGVYPVVPLVSGDDDIAPHPYLGSDLCLPSLLRIPTLRKLIIRDTHLGDPRWATTPVACKLQVLDLGSCYHETDDYNRLCTERIMAAVGPTIDEFSLTTAVADEVFAKPTVTPMQRLRKLHISPFFPVDSVVDTVSNLAGSPIETLSMQCYEEDVIDMCSALEEFLSLRVERGPEFYEKLRRLDVFVAANEDADVDDEDASAKEDCAERAEAVKRLQEFCRDLQLASQVGKVAVDAITGKTQRSGSSAADDACDKRPVGHC